MASIVRDQQAAQHLAATRNALREKLINASEKERPMLEAQIDFLTNLINILGRNITKASWRM